MANTNLRQTKRARVLLDLEATLGTYETPDANSIVLPVTAPSFAPSRGTRIIDRTATQDGYMGDVDGAVGSFGWTTPLEVDIHNANTRVPYWAQLMLMAGHAGEDLADYPATGDVSLALYPTVGNITANANLLGDLTPCTGSLTLSRLNNGQDTAMRTRGNTGSITFNLTANQIVTMSFAGVGLVVNDTLYDTSDVDQTADGSVSAWRTPFRYLNAVVELLDGGGNPVQIPSPNSITLTSGAETPDVPEPTEAQGFAISPVYWNTSPTISFTFAEVDDNADEIMARLFTGETMSLNVTLQDPSGRNLRLECPRIQFTDVVPGDQGGWFGYTVSGKLTREAGIPTSEVAAALYRFIWVYNPA